MIRDLDYNTLRKAVQRKGHAWFEKASRPYDINLVGIRNKSTVPDYFDDTLCVAYLDLNGYARLFTCPVTVDPSLYYIKNPINSSGALIIKPGQYRTAYKLGKHRGYDAIVQVKPITVIRDFNKDGKLDFKSGREQSGCFGANIHRTLPDGIAKTVQKFSAGCQVVQSIDDFKYVYSLIRRQSIVLGTDYVSYTLLEEKDF